MLEDLIAPDMWLKLLLAIACGAAIGFERELADKPAGLRTHMLISVGSTLITMVSIHVALVYGERQVHITDPGRIAAQIVTGIGFLGAGTIIQARGAIHGLTTAATIWVMAGVGMAIGVEMYGTALAATVVLLAILELLERVASRLQRHHHFIHFRILASDTAGLLDAINDVAEAEGLNLQNFHLERHESQVRMEFALTCSPESRDLLVERVLQLDPVEDVRVNE